MTSKTDILRIKITTDGAGKTTASLASVEKGLDGIDRKSKGASRSLAGVAGAIAGVFTARAIAGFVSYNIEYQKMQAMLKTVEGDQAKANVQFEKLQEFARTTPFQLQEVVQGYIKLSNLGLKPTEELMRSLGNTSAAMGKSFDQLVEAVADAAVNEFERLKDFGIKASKEGDKISFNFRNVVTTVGASSEEITDYLQSLGENDFATGMSDQMDTLGGSVSNLKQAFFELVTTIGDAGVSEFFDEWTGAAEKALRDTKELFKENSPAEQLAEDAREAVKAQMQAAIDEYNLFFQALASGPEGTQARNLLRLKGIDTETESLLGRITALAAEIHRLDRQFKEVTETGERYVEASKSNAEATDVVADSIKKLTAEEKKAIAEARKYLKSLQTKNATFKLSRAELILYEAQTKAAGIADKALAEQVLAAADALAAQVRETEEAVEATKSLRQQEQLYREELEQKEQAQREWLELLELLDPAQAKVITRTNQLAAADDALFAAAMEGLITAEQYEEWLENLPGLLDAAAGSTEAYQKVWERSLERMDDSLANIWVDMASGSKDVFDGILDGFIQMLAQMTHEATTQRIIVNLQGGMTDDGSIDGGQLGADLLSTAGLVIGAKIGGGGQGANMGAMIGSAIGSIWGPVGSMVGSLLGGLAGGLFDSDPNPRVWVSGDPSLTKSRRRKTYNTQLGNVVVDSKEIEDAAALGRAIQDFDKQIAALLTSLELPTAIDALAGHTAKFTGDDVTAEEILADRFSVILKSVEPEFARFIEQLGDLEAQVVGFVAIRGIEEMVDSIGDLKDELSTDPLSQIKIQLKQAREAEAESIEAVVSAVARMDPATVADAAVSATQAIIRRYQAEIQMVDQLRAAIEAVEARGRSMGVDVASRIAALTGDRSDLLSRLGVNIDFLQGSVLDSQDTERALAHLGEFTATVDRWLQEQRAAVNQMLAEGLAALDQEAAAVITGAERRTQAQLRALDRQQQALEEQLRLAEDWSRVLETARGTIESMTLSSANPLSGQGRMGLLESQIAAARAEMESASPGAQPEIAARLIELLRQQLALGGDLFQRPSSDYIQLYNETLAQLHELEALAADGNSAEGAIEVQLLRLQERANELTSEQINLTAGEQALLRDIEARRQVLQDEANRQLAEIEAQALEYYTWAQSMGEELNERRHAELTAALNEITGGLDPDSFIAQQQLRAANLLEDIRTKLSEFLDAASAGSAVGVPSDPRIPGFPYPGDPRFPLYPRDAADPVDSAIGGPVPDRPITQPGTTVTIANTHTFVINGGDPDEIKELIQEVTRKEMLEATSVLKEELRVA